MTDPNDDTTENTDKTQEQCSNDEENDRHPYQARYGKSTWMPSMHTDVFTMDGEEFREEFNNRFPEDRLDDIIHIEPTDDPECPACNALTALPKRVRKELEAEPLELDTDRDDRHTQRSGANIEDMLADARRKTFAMATAGKGKSPSPLPGDIIIDPRDSPDVSAFPRIRNIERETRKYRQERITEEFGSVPEYMQAVIEDLEELARTGPHYPQHRFSPSHPVPAPGLYPIKHLRVLGRHIDRMRLTLPDEDDREGGD